MVDSNENPKISTSKRCKLLAGVAGPSGVSENVNSLQDPRSKKTLPIVAKFARVGTKVVNGIKALTSGKIYFEYAANGLKIRTIPATDHQNVSRYLVGILHLTPQSRPDGGFHSQRSPTHHPM